MSSSWESSQLLEFSSVNWIVFCVLGVGWTRFWVRLCRLLFVLRLLRWFVLLLFLITLELDVCLFVLSFSLHVCCLFLFLDLDFTFLFVCVFSEFFWIHVFYASIAGIFLCFVQWLFKIIVLYVQILCWCRYKWISCS